MSNSIQKIADIWARSTNPLRNLNARQIEQMLSNSRLGNDVQLQQCYALVEQSMPIFGICIQKRISGILSRKWDIVPIYDDDESKRQADIVKQHFLESDTLTEDGLSDAIRHLALGAFRGRSYVKPFLDDDGLTFKIIQNWHVARVNGREYWNPQALDCIDDFTKLTEIPKKELCYTLNDHPIDMPGIMIYLRQMVGETKWAQFIERQGVPQIVITAPDGTPDSAMPAWAARSMQLFNGASGTLPYGSDVKELTSGRGQDPFSAFCQHQMELISILATGGALATIGGATGLGSNLADVQNQQFQCLISEDCKKIENTLTSGAVRKIAARLQQPLRCRFQYVEEEELTAAQHVELAKALKDLGATIDVAKLKEIVNLPYITDGDDQIWQPNQQEQK